MNNEFKNNNLINQEAYESVDVAEEEVIYCDAEYDEEPETLLQEEEQSDVPCYVMEGSYFTPENIYAANQDHSVCHFCKEDLSNKRFYNHLFDHHGFTKQQCEMMKQQKRLENFKDRPNYKRKSLHSCSSCGMEFITKTGLNSHLKKGGPCSRPKDIPESDGSKVNNIACPGYGCQRKVGTYMDLAIHVDTEHRAFTTVADSFRIRRMNFPDKSGFMRWKREMEETTGSQFFLRTSQKVTFAIRTLLYKCNMSNSRGAVPSKPCEQCPAFIKCCQRTHGQFEVVACFGHLGHEHRTESLMAQEMRILKNQELEMLQEARESQIHHQTDMRRQRTQLIVNRPWNHNQTNDGMMILMPEGEEVVEEVNAFPSVVVDDADDEIVGPNDQQNSSISERRVYLPSNHHPDSSHY